MYITVSSTKSLICLLMLGIVGLLRIVPTQTKLTIMIKDLKDVFSVLIPIRSFKYLWRALGNFWRVLVLTFKYMRNDGQRMEYGESVNKIRQSGGCSAADFFELARKHQEWQEGEQNLAADLAQNKPGFFKSLFLLPINIGMAIICGLPLFGVMVGLSALEKPVAKQEVRADQGSESQEASDTQGSTTPESSAVQGDATPESGVAQ